MKDLRAKALIDYCSRFNTVYIYFTISDQNIVPDGLTCVELQADHVTRVDEAGFRAELFDRGRKFFIRVVWESVFAMHDGDVTEITNWDLDATENEIDEPTSAVVRKLPDGWCVHEGGAPRRAASR